MREGGYMRRKAGALLPIEIEILAAGLHLASHGVIEFHGYSVARELEGQQGARRLIGHGTLYKALDRLERAQLLESWWEDPLRAAEERRPLRRLYRVTDAGERVLREHGRTVAVSSRPMAEGAQLWNPGSTH
jgi:PadR family transcriptional regulator, regulatory protein PadR